MMEPSIFPYDHEIWRQQQSNQWLVLLFLPVLMFGCLFFTPFFFWLEIKVAIGVAAAIFLLSTLALIWFQRTTFNRKRDAKLLLDHEAITHAYTAPGTGNNYTANRIPYSKMTGLQITHDRRQQPFFIRIQADNKQLDLSGFRNMPQLVTKLTQHLPTTCQVTHKRTWLRIPTPGCLFLILIIVAFLLILSAQANESFIFQLFVAGIVGYVAMSFFRRGWQKYRDPKRKPWELPTDFVLGIIYLGIILWSLIDDPEAWNLVAYWNNPCRMGQQLAGETGCLATFPGGESSFFLSDSKTLVRQQFGSVIIAPPSAWVNSRTPQLPYDGDLDIYGLSANRQMLLACPNFGCDTFQVWNIGARFLSRQFTLDDSFYEEEIAISANGAYVAVSGNKALYIYDVIADQITHQWPHNGKKAPLTFTPDEGTLILFNELERPVIVDRDTGTPQQVLLPPENMAVANPKSLVFSADGRFLAATYEGNDVIVVWEWASKQVYQTLTIPPEAGYMFLLDTAAAFSPDNRYLALGTHRTTITDTELFRNNYLFLWSLADGTLIQQTFLGIESDYRPVTLDFSPDGQLLAVSMENIGYVFAVDKLVAKP